MDHSGNVDDYVVVEPAVPDGLFDAIAFCPFEPEISPYAERVERHSIWWARSFGLAESPSVADRLERGRFGRLAARVYPRGDAESIELAGDWITWLFLFDDLCDEQDLGRNPRSLKRFTERLNAAHTDARFVAAGPFEEAVADLGQRFRERAASDSWQRLCSSVDDYFGSLVWEAENRAAGRVPVTSDYIAMRPLTGAMTIVIDIADVTDGIDLAANMRTDRLLSALTMSACYVVCWTNDIVSAPKESAVGDVHNLVLATSAEQGVTVADAVQQAAVALRNEIQHYVDLEASVSALGADDNMASYLAMLRAWMRGYMDWVIETRRYGDLGGERPGVVAQDVA